MEILLVTSTFPAALAAHNSTSRYMFSMGRERLLPARFGRTTERWQSPSLASLTMSVVSAIVLVAVVASGGDPYLHFGGPVLALGTVGIMALQAAASVAVFVFFRRIKDHRLWTTITAPILASAGLVTAIVLILGNYGMVSGSESSLVNNLPWVFVIAAVVGLGVVSYLKAKEPAAYQHLEDEDPTSAVAPQIAD